MLKNRFINRLLFAVLPLAYGIAYVAIGSQKGPYWWTGNQDPDYAYLLNSLLVANLKAPGHTDHPGTPVQVLGGLVLRIGHLFQPWFNSPAQNITEDVLSHSELYLQLINYTLIFLTACSLLLLGIVCFQISKSYRLTLILQTVPFLTAITVVANEPSRVAPENFLFCLGQLLVLLLVSYVYIESAATSRWFAIALGVILGVGTAAKVTFIPIFLFVLLLPKLSRKLLAVGVAVAAFFIATSPIASLYQRALQWLWLILTHEGIYGTGQEGLVDPPRYLENLGLLLSRNPVFSTLALLLTLACCLVYWRRSWQSSQGSTHHWQTHRICQLSGIVAVVMISQMGMAAIESGHARYIVPAVSLIGLSVFLLIHLCFLLLRSILNLPSLLSKLTTVALMICVAISLQQLYLSATNIAQVRHIYQHDLATLQEQIYQNPTYAQCQIVFDKRAPALQAALYFGNLWTTRGQLTDKAFGTPLNQLYPDALFYNEPVRAGETYSSFAQRIRVTDLFQRGQGCVLLVTKLLRDNEFPQLVQAELLLSGKVVEVYRLSLK